MKYLTLRVPRESDNTPEQTAQLLASLARAASAPSLFDKLSGVVPVQLSLELTIVAGQITFVIVYPDHLDTFVRSQIQATYPDVVMAETKDYLADWEAAAGDLIRLSYPSYFPLRDYMDYKEVDPMLPLLGVLSKAKETDRVLVQFILLPPDKSIRSQSYHYLHPKAKYDDAGHKEVIQPEGKKLVEDKLTQPLVGVSIRFASNNPDILHDLAGAVSVLNRPDGNSLAKAPLLFPWQRTALLKAIWAREPYRPFNIPPTTLNVLELSSLWHLPGVFTKLPNIAWSPSASLSEPPESLPIHSKSASEDILQHTNFFATTTFRNKQVIFGLKLEDRLRHTYVLGKSGTGKSTLLENMAIDDFKKGRGVAFIDPHGDSAEVLLNYIPGKRMNDVVYFNPADREYPISLNILEISSPDQAELVTSGIVAIFHKLYSHSWGPRLEYILRNTILTLTLLPGSTLPDVIKILTDDVFRRQVYQKLKNSQLLSFWHNEYDVLDLKTRMEYISPILNKVGQFVNSPLIQSIISTPKSSVDLKRVMDEGKIFIANLSQGKLGEDNSALLGAMLVTQIEIAAMSRVEMPKEKRKDFFLYVDEFQNFATDSFIKILSEARKFRLGLILANQYIGQIPEHIQKAILGNAGTIICFVLGSEDAAIIEKEFGGLFTQVSLVSLQKHQVAMRMTIDAASSNPFTAETLPPMKSSNNNRSKVIEMSRKRYALKQPKTLQKTR